MRKPDPRAYVRLAALLRDQLAPGEPQDPHWNAEQLPGGQVRWTLPSGRQHVTEPTRYPI